MGIKQHKIKICVMSQILVRKMKADIKSIGCYMIGCFGWSTSHPGYGLWQGSLHESCQTLMETHESRH